jgi:phosphoribosylformylglycinamidine (FGAM) synthase-like enzyme
LAVALVEPAFAKGIGLKVDITSNELPAEFALFGEDASRVVMSCDATQLDGIKEIAAKHGLTADMLGETVSGQVEIRLDGQVLVSASVAELRDGYESALEKALRTEPEAVAAD